MAICGLLKICSPAFGVGSKLLILPENIKFQARKARSQSASSEERRVARMATMSNDNQDKGDDRKRAARHQRGDDI